MPLFDPSGLKPPLRMALIQDTTGLQLLREFVETTDALGFDVETNVAPDFTKRYLRTIQLGNKEQQFVIDMLAFAGSEEALRQQGNKTAPAWATPVVQVIKPILDSDRWLKVGHNLQFDYEAVLWCLGIYSWNFYDTMLAEKALYAGQVHFKIAGFWAMDDLLKRYFKIDIDKSLQKSFDLSSPLTDEQVVYAALDTRFPLALKAAQYAHIVKARLERVVEIENNAIPAFGSMHVDGFKLSTTKWMAIVDETAAKHKDNIKVLDTFFIPAVGSKHKTFPDIAPIEERWRGERDRDKRAAYRKEYQEAAKAIREHNKALDTFEGEAAINYGSQVQLLKALQKLGFSAKKLKNTSDRELKKLKSLPIIAAIIAFRKSAKVMTTYGVTFLENINPTTNRIHSKIDQYGAETGRTTSSAPNIQNIPRGSAWRACFVPEDYCSLITNDYNGCELRILAECSGEPVWIDAFNKGWDVHSVGAEIIFGRRWAEAAEEGCLYYKEHQKCSCKGHKILRDQIKAINFGIAYGMEAGKLADSLGITKPEAQELLDKYRAEFTKVTRYLAECGDESKRTLECRTMSDRRRLFPKPTWEKAKEKAEKMTLEYGRVVEVSSAYYAMYGSIEREGKNTPIQGTNADMVKLAVGCGRRADGKGFYLWHRMREYGAKLVNIVHDELVYEVVDDLAKEFEAVVGDCMVAAGGEFVKSIPMTYEGCIAKMWSK